MRKQMRKVVLGILGICIGVVGFCIDTYAAETVSTVKVEAKYDQTDARRMLQSINDFRTSTTDAWYWNEDNKTKTVYNTGNNKKLGTLVYDYDLEAIAMQRAAEIALQFSHTRPNGQAWSTTLSNKNRSYGENIAAGYTSVEDVFEGWQETNKDYSGQGHRRNMLIPGFQSVGVGYAVVNGVKCWVQEFSYYTYNTGMVSGRDGNQKVNVDILDSYLSNVKAVPSKSIVSALIGEHVELPTVDTTIMLKETWGSPNGVPVTTDYAWNVADTNIARIVNGALEGVVAGSTNLTTTILGQQVSVTVNIFKQQEKEHSYDGGVVMKEATCIEKGIMKYTCKGCGASYTEDIPALGHDWPDENEYTVIVAPSCTEAGLGYRYCKRSGCNWYYSKTIAPTGHTIVVDPAVPATTTMTGLTEGSHCSICNMVIAKQSVIPMLKSDSTEIGQDTKTQTDVIKKTQIAKVTPAKKSFTITWKKTTSKCDGYEISYATRKNMKDAKVIRVAANKKSVKIKKLKAKKKYYVRIRAYRNSKTTKGYSKNYSAWSKTKTIKTK